MTVEEAKKIKVPIFLHEGLAERLYKKMITIQEYLQKHSNATHNDLFQKIEPILFRYYQSVLEKHPNDIVGATAALYTRAATVEELVDLQTRINTLQKLQTAIALRTAKPFDWENNRTQGIENALESFIASLDFGKMKGEIQLLFFSYIRKFKGIAHLSIKNSVALDSRAIDLLMPLISHLRKLILVECPMLQCEDLKRLIRSFPKLIIVLEYVSNMINFSSEDWLELSKISKKLFVKIGEEGIINASELSVSKNAT